MCFSATVSFATAATLIPVGAYCLHTSRTQDKHWMAFAAYPLAFGIQQALEGVVWYGLNANNPELVNLGARSYVFFSHFFWLLWVPLSVFLVEPAGFRKTALAALTLVGGSYGVSIFLPLIINEGWLSVEVLRHCLNYKTTVIYDGLVGRQIIHIIYALLVVTAFFVSSHHGVRFFGALILASVIGAFIFFKYAFISVWCFFAALLSVYVLYLLRSQEGIRNQLKQFLRRPRCPQ